MSRRKDIERALAREANKILEATKDTIDIAKDIYNTVNSSESDASKISSLMGKMTQEEKYKYCRKLLKRLPEQFKEWLTLGKALTMSTVIHEVDNTPGFLEIFEDGGFTREGLLKEIEAELIKQNPCWEEKFKDDSFTRDIYLKQNPNGVTDASSSDVSTILDDILTVRDPWRAEWLDARFEKDKRKMNIHYLVKSNGSIVDKSEVKKLSTSKSFFKLNSS